MNICIYFDNYVIITMLFLYFLMMYGPLALKSKEINIQLPINIEHSSAIQVSVMEYLFCNYLWYRNKQQHCLY